MIKVHLFLEILLGLIALVLRFLLILFSHFSLLRFFVTNLSIAFEIIEHTEFKYCIFLNNLSYLGMDWKVSNQRAIEFIFSVFKCLTFTVLVRHLKDEGTNTQVFLLITFNLFVFI
jgi:hypothetical protein